MKQRDLGSTVGGTIACVLLMIGSQALADTAPPTTTTTNSSPWGVHPRFLLEVQRPLVVGVSGGLWLWLPQDPRSQKGLVIDAEVGLRGSALHLGFGASGSPDIGWEGLWSFGAQAVVLRSASNNPWLSPSTFYGGAEVFGHVAVFRCSLGFLVSLESGVSSVGSVLAGCGVGLP